MTTSTQPTPELMIRISDEHASKQVWVPAAALVSLILTDGMAFNREYHGGSYVFKYIPNPETDLPSFAVSTKAALTALVAAERITK
jgi:hypothetical protein